VGPANLSPIHPELRSILSSRRRRFGDEGDALAEVERRVLLGIDTLDLDEGGVVVLVAQASLVAEDGTVDVEASWLGSLLHFSRIKL